MEVPLLLQFSIALFTGMVASTFVPPVRQSIPRAVEVLLWIGFVTVCGLGVLSITDPNARELSTSAAWGVDQTINTMVGLFLSGVLSWISDHRFAIATWMIIVAGVDLMALVLIRSQRAGMGWQPRVRLGEWMEMPVPGSAAGQPVAMSDPMADLNRRIAGAMAIAGTAVLEGLLNLSIWVRDVMVPHGAGRLVRAAETGRTRSRASLESLRDSTAHLHFAARAWYAAAGRPAISNLGAKAVHYSREAQRGLHPAKLRPGQVIDIQALLSAQSIGWYGPLSAGPSKPAPGEHDGPESERSDRLAS